MKILRFFVLLCSMSYGLYAYEGGIPTEKYTIRENDKLASAEFEIEFKDEPVGKIDKNRFSHFPDIVRTHYDLKNANDQLESFGISGFFSSGTYSSWKTEMYIYEPNGLALGKIDGDSLTAKNAHFSIYDASNQLIGIASLDLDKKSFKVVRSEGENKPIIIIEKVLSDNSIDHWDYKVFVPLIDHRILKIFVAFVIDHHNYLLED